MFKKKKKEYQFSEDLLWTRRKLFIGWSRSDFNKSHDLDCGNDETRGFTVETDWQAYVWVNPSQTWRKEKSIIVHELIHVVLTRMTHIGIDSTDDNWQEVIARLYQYYYDKLSELRLV